MNDEAPQLNLKQQQKALEDALRHVASSTGSVEALTAPALKQQFPKVFAAEAPAQAEDAKRSAGSLLLSALRALCLDLATEAAKAGQPPMQYAARTGNEPTLPRLLALALLCQQQGLVDAPSILQICEDLQDLCVTEHCLDIITWLEQHRTLLASPGFSAANNQLTRLCNSILKRLGKHQVVSKARLMILLASCTPPFDRSGVGVAGTLAPADPPAVEDVPAGAVDSAGKPVDAALYKRFWGLQALLQDPVAVLTSQDRWATFKDTLAFVLGELAKSPASVAAVRSTDAVAANSSQGAADAGDAAAATAAAAEVTAQEDAQGVAQCYLSSYKLFGLQLADSSFRRGFLVQVLVMLRTLLLPGRVPTETLKPKQRMEAIELEKEVYKLLDATPNRGKDFSRAVREVLEREVTWVEWKKGGKGFVVPGIKADAAAAPAPAPAGANKKAQPAITSCIDWSKPPIGAITAAVQQARQESGRKRRLEETRVQEGMQLKQEIDHMGRQYNCPEGFVNPREKQQKLLRLMGNGSSLTFWARAQRPQALAPTQQPLLSGLKVSEQPAYPLPRAVCKQLVLEMDPELGMEASFKRVAEDSVYRWRIGRTVAQEIPEYDGSLITGEGLEAAMMQLMPDEVPEAYRVMYNEKIKSEEAAKAAKQQGPAGKGGRHAAAAKGSGIAAAPAAAAAAAAQSVGAGDGDASMQPIKQELAAKEDAAVGGEAADGEAAAAEADTDAAVAEDVQEDADVDVPAEADTVKEEEQEAADGDVEAPAEAVADDEGEVDAAGADEADAGDAGAGSMDVDQQEPQSEQS